MNILLSGEKSARQQAKEICLGLGDSKSRISENKNIMKIRKFCSIFFPIKQIVSFKSMTIHKTAASQTGTDGEAIIAEGGNRKPADAFDMGGGLVNPNKAANPGLIYDMNMGDYIQFLCSMGYSNSLISSAAKKNISCLINSRAVIDMNLPSICIPNLKRTVTISRTVTNVGPFNSSYTALVQSPHGFKVAIKPQILSFNSSTTTLSFKMTFSSTQKVHGDYSFGSLTWTDGSHYVRSPIVVRAIKFESYADM